MIALASVLAFCAGLAVAAFALTRTGRITIVVVRHSALRPRGPDGRFLTDRQAMVGAALEAASKQTGAFGR